MIDSGIFLEYEIASVQQPDSSIAPAIEVPFEITVKNFSLADEKNIPVTYAGYIDAILYDAMTDEFIVVDIKTTRDNLNDKTAVYFFDTQCLPYALVLDRILGHEVQTLTVKYMSVYVDIARPSTKVYTFQKSRSEIRDWARTFYLQLQTIKRYYNMAWFPRRPSSCVKFKKVCEHFDICQQRDPEAIQKLLSLETLQPDKVIDPWFRLDLEFAA